MMTVNGKLGCYYSRYAAKDRSLANEGRQIIVPFRSDLSVREAAGYAYLKARYVKTRNGLFSIKNLVASNRRDTHMPNPASWLPRSLWLSACLSDLVGVNLPRP